jgi:SAM-dependent methyltransferase
VTSRDVLLADVAAYYEEKLHTHGQTARGVDWNGEESQLLRFKRLCSLINGQLAFSINDLGCGYGALYDFLSAEYECFSYEGIDVAEGMIIAARERFQEKSNAKFEKASKPSRLADYCVASGIFNVRLEQSDSDWWAYIKSVLNTLDEYSHLGFSFNCLTSYSEEAKMRDYLYYADPCALFDFCKRHYSRNVSLLHDYDLYEFTILVRKQL